MKKYKLVLGNTLNIIYLKLFKLKRIKNIELENNDIFINIMDKKILSKLTKQNVVLRYKNLKIESSNKDVYFSNSAYYTAKDHSFIIHYREFIPSGKQVDKLFFIHGFGACTIFYDDLIKKLVNKGYYCLSLDLPGWGLSSKCESYTQDVRSKQICELLTYINKKNRNYNKWIAIGHSMGGGCILNMSNTLIKKKIIFNPAIKPIINNFIKLNNKYIINLLNLFSNKRWFMDNVLAFVDRKELDEQLYLAILNQIPDAFTMVKTLIEGFDTYNLDQKNKDIPVYICLSDNDTVVGNHEMVMSELLNLPNVKLTKVEGSHVFILNNMDSAYTYIIDCLKK